MLFLYKPNFWFQPAKIVKKVCQPAGEFEQFLKNPLENLPCISENVDLMREDDQEVFQCLLVTGEGRRDGVLVQSEGYDYARYASYVPDAPALEHESLSEFGVRLSWLVERIIQEGAEKAADGNGIFYYDKIEELSGLSLSENPELANLLADMLLDRPEMSQVNISGDHFDLCFYPDCCPGCREEKKEDAAQTLTEEPVSHGTAAKQSGISEEKAGTENKKVRTQSTLKDLLNTRWENLHLVHDEIDYGLPHTIVELDAGTLTEAGKEAWADVLEAKVVCVFQGYSGLQMELSGVKASRLDAFSAMLAGYCSVEDYESWVNETEEELASPVIQKG